MSAYMVDKAHVDLLVDVAIRGPRGVAVQPCSWFPPYLEAEGERQPVRAGDEDRLGQLLVSENLHSIAYRYPDTVEGGDIPGSVDEYYVLPYRFSRRPYRLTAVEALSAIACYRYQACEHPEWVTSSAYRFISDLEHALIGTLTAGCPWGWSEKTIREAMATA